MAFAAPSTISFARASPFLAASNTSSPVMRSGSPPAILPMRESGDPGRRSLAIRAMPVPEASSSKQPALPHLQGTPFHSMLMCPTSPAMPWAPQKGRPSMTIPPPMPVLMVMYTRVRAPMPDP